MPLTCSCDDYDDYDWWHDGGREVKPLATKRMRRCCSCKDRIAVGDDAKEFVRWRNPDFDSIEYRIHGDEVPMPSWWMCDRCAGLYESLESLGFCVSLGESMVELAREYGEMQRAAGIFRGRMVMASNAAITRGGTPSRA